MSLLFTPIKIGSLTLPNRTVMPAMHMNFTPDGHINEQAIEFYRLRAKGGVGLIIIGGCPVERDSVASFMVGIHDDKFKPGLTKLADAIHEEGGKCGIQLYHAGRYTFSFFLGGKPAPSASSTMSPLTREQSKEMTKEDIKDCIDDFCAAAKRAKDCGFDAVEVISSAGYLINQFYSTVTNKRTDEYGGSVENRMRFGIEVVTAVRKAVGPDFPVTIRFAGNDFVKDSNTNEENRLLAIKLDEAGADMFNVTGGWHESRVPQITNALPSGGYSYLARNIKRMVSVPVAAANRINTPEQAERLLEEGWCDMVSLGRSMITDPNWVKKAEAGKSEDIVQCLSCNQRCLDNVFMVKPVSCLLNPMAGLEHLGEATKTDPKKALVIGGGPAGLMAAAVLAKRGHDVTLWEKTDRFGGQIIPGYHAPNKDAFRNLPVMLSHQARIAGAKLEKNKEATKEEIDKFNPDLLVLATGAVPMSPPIDGADGDNVLNPLDVLERKVNTGDKVAVIGGGPIGLETAISLATIGTISSDVAAFLLKHEAEKPEVIRELLLKGNKEVTLIEMTPKIGTGIGKSTKWVAIKEVEMHNIEVVKSAKATKIDGKGVYVETEEGEKLIEADSVVMAAGMTPFNPLADIAEGFGGEVITIGDADKVSDAAGAINDAFTKLREV